MRAVVMIRLVYDADHLNAKDLQQSWLQAMDVGTYEDVVEVNVTAKILGVRNGKIRNYRQDRAEPSETGS